jgi:hypothetical protein
VTLSVYDILGKKVADLLNGMRQPGEHQLTFPASDLPSGVYFYRLGVSLLDPAEGERVQVRKLIIAR